MSDDFKIAFFGSSNFVKPILQDILDSRDETMAQIASDQLDWLVAQNDLFQSVLAAKILNSDNVRMIQEAIKNTSELHKKPKIQLVVTQPKRENRGKLISNPVFEYAEQNSINVFAPYKLKTELDQFNQSAGNLDIGIVASYGQILPQEVLDYPKFGLINWHPSSLPKYRGPTPMQTALFNGDKETGLSWIEVGAGMDSGPLLLQLNFLLTRDQDFFGLADYSGELGVLTWALAVSLQVLQRKNIFQDIKPIEQDENSVVLCKMLNKEDKWVDPKTMTSELIWNHWRAYQMFPGTWIRNEGKEVKLIQLGEIKGLADVKEKALQMESQDNILRIETKAGWENWLVCNDQTSIKVVKSNQ